jgi:hypothetical protein
MNIQGDPDAVVATAAPGYDNFGYCISGVAQGYGAKDLMWVTAPASKD